MTIILGVQAVDGIVLASDTSLLIRNEEHDDYKDRSIRKKINIGDYHALAWTGIDDKYLQRFFNYFAGRRDLSSFLEYLQEASGSEGLPNLPTISTSGISPLERAISDKHIWEFELCNRLYLKRGGDFDEASEFILATNKPRLSLYHVDSMGNVAPAVEHEGVNSFALGGSASNLGGYLSSHEYEDDPFVAPHIDPDNITLPVAIRIAIGALKKAYKHIDAGGTPDMAIITRNTVEAHGDFLRKAITEAETGAWQAIIRKYETPTAEIR